MGGGAIPLFWIYMTSIIKGPVAPFSNLPIHAEYFQPSQFFISAITLGQTTTVTTTANDNYVVGQLVRFIIPPTFGTRQLNGQTGYVISLPAANQVQVAINSTGFDAFISDTAKTQPQLLPVGDVNSGQTNSNGITSILTFIPGSFINISPL
jgi:hypothetical protein